jgi:hypothetical protein
MPKPYSLDLRERVVRFVDEGSLCVRPLTSTNRTASASNSFPNRRCGLPMKCSSFLQKSSPQMPGKSNRAVLDFVKGHVFDPADFIIRTDGVCRLNPEMARMVVARIIHGNLSRSSGRT